MTASTRLLIFTDLDGTLMAHDSYDVQPAYAALAELARRGLTPILNSSKTRQEILTIQQQLALDAPCICENGAALYPGSKPAGGVSERVFGLPLDSWLDRVWQIRSQWGFRFEGFSDWSAATVCKRTGLTPDQAALAKQRQFSEPILWQDSAEPLRQFRGELRELGLQLVEGGRFLSIQGPHDKATAMTWLQQQSGNRGTLTVALGDSPNDCAMLEAADIAVVIQSAKSAQLDLRCPQQVIRSQRPGPAGWQDAITDILARLDAGELP